MSDHAPGPVEIIDTPIELVYRYMPGRAASRFLRGIEQGKILGQRCPSCRKVYVPPRGACAACGVATDEEVQLTDKGTVTTSFPLVPNSGITSATFCSGWSVPSPNVIHTAPAKIPLVHEKMT